MKVDLAYPFTTDDGVKHAPDETVDLPDPQALKLIRGGRARLASVKSTPKHALKRTPEPAPDPAPETGAEQAPLKGMTNDQSER